MTTSSGNARIEALYEKEKALRVRIAMERQKVERQKARERAALEKIIGGAVVDQASLSAELQLTITRVLDVTITDERQRQFLRDRGWL